MLSRREFLLETLKKSSLLAVGAAAPTFLVNTARAAAVGKDNILVVIELTGGNDGLNTVIPYADDLYHKARPTLRFRKEQVLRIDDAIGLHPGLNGIQQFIQQGWVGVVQGVGYPNPDRSHFESMDIWHSADHTRKTPTGWMARSSAELQIQHGGVPAMQVGPEKLPLALRGSQTSVASLNHKLPFKLRVGGVDAEEIAARKKLLVDLSKAPQPGEDQGILQFVQKTELQTYTAIEQLQEILKNLAPDGNFPNQKLTQKMQIVAQLIQRGLGTRLFYLALDGFDTHSEQGPAHQNLMQDLGQAIATLFYTLQSTGHDKRVIVMTYSEFGRRVQENGSKGTDHGAGSSMFVIGPAVKGGAVGKHPSLSDLDAGDLKHHTDFRRVYATLLDQWLNCDSKTLLLGFAAYSKTVLGDESP